MPPKAKITKDMILHTVLNITRESGFETVNARSIANKLQCSTRPIFTCYESMEQLKGDFLDFAFAYFDRYAAAYRGAAVQKPYLLRPLSYIQFAKEEPCLFKLLFISDMALKMEKPNDFYREIGNREKAKEFSDSLGVEPECGERIFLDLFLYSHGIAVLTATEKLSFDEADAEKMLVRFLSAALQQEKAKGEAGVPNETEPVSD